MATFTIYTPTPDIDQHWQPALGYAPAKMTAKDILKAYRADADNLPYGYKGAGERCYNRESYMYLLKIVEDENLLMVGCESAPRWLERLCDKCESEIANEDD